MGVFVVGGFFAFCFWGVFFVCLLACFVLRSLLIIEKHCKGKVKENCKGRNKTIKEFGIFQSERAHL